MCEDCVASRDVAVGTTQNALDASTIADFNPGDVQILVVKRAPLFFEQQIRTPIDPTLPPVDALAQILPPEIDIIPHEFENGRQAAEVRFVDQTTGATTLIWLIDTGNGQRGALLVTGASSDVEVFRPQILLIAETMTAAAPSVPGVVDGDVPLVNTFINDAGTRRVRYPEGWLFTETQRGAIFFGTSAETLTNEDLTLLFPGEILGLIYPTPDLIPNYQPGEDATTPLNAVTFLTTAGVTSGEYQEDVAPQAIQLDGREAAVSVTSNGRTQQIILAIAGEENTITMIAFTSVSTGEEARLALEAILATVETGTFTPPTATEEAATTEEAT